MKPQRLAAMHNLVVNYELHKCMTVLEPPRATEMDLTRFHSPEYVDFLKRVSPANAEHFESQFNRFNIGEDWSVFMLFFLNNFAFFKALIKYNFVCSIFL